jgi:hypothetical protein
MRLFCIVGLFMAALEWAGAEELLKCVVCDVAIEGKFYWMDGITVSRKQPVCKACSQLDTTCSACALPVKFNFKTLNDGRLLCRHDAAVAVLSQQAAERTFADARRDLLHSLARFGVLPDRNIKVHLVTRTEIDRMRGANAPGHSKTILMGLTQTTLVDKEQFEHSIYVIDGLPPARFLAVCAHEWAHAWVHENVPRERKLDASSTEGFCEWVAYKLMSERNETIEKKIILANPYTRGQVEAFVKADEDLRPYDIVKWMKEGMDGRIDAGNTGRVRLVQEQSPPQALLWQSSAPTRVPDQLTLRGISGNANRRFALINDCTLQKNETAKVRIGSTNVVLQCLRIGADSVTVRVRGSDQPTELFLSKIRN